MSRLPNNLELVQRPDDNEQTILERFDEYQDQDCSIYMIIIARRETLTT
jgi:adenylate kinase family enzyme